jgi:hypothetical protein
MQAQQIIKLLDVENHQLRDEVARLARAAKERSYHVRRVKLALDDALLLALFQASGIAPSRRYARLKSMSQNRWQNAMALLRMARVVVRRRHWATDNLADIEKRLGVAAKRAIDHPDAYWARLIKHGRQ